MFLSMKLVPFSVEIAFWASASELISMNPNPRALPVAASVISFAERTSPAFEKRSFRSSSDAWNEMLPT